MFQVNARRRNLRELKELMQILPMSKVSEMSEKDVIFVCLSNVREMNWLSSTIHLLEKNFTVVLVGLYSSQRVFEKAIPKSKSKKYFIDFQGPLQIFTAGYSMLNYLFHHRPRVILSHGLYASLISALLSRSLPGCKVISVRHHGYGNANIKKLKFLDLMVNRFADRHVAISKLTQVLLISEKVHPEKITYIPNAICIREHPEKNRNYIKNEFDFRKALNIEDTTFLIGSASRFVDWKGVEYTINAFREFCLVVDNSHLLLINALGFTQEIENALSSIDPKKYTLIEELEDIEIFYSALDVFVHVPVSPTSEPFGLVYLESLVSGVPCIFTRSGVLIEMSETFTKVFYVDYRSENDILLSLFECYKLGSEFVTRTIPSKYALDQNSQNTLELIRKTLGN